MSITASYFTEYLNVSCSVVSSIVVCSAVVFKFVYVVFSSFCSLPHPINANVTPNAQSITAIFFLISCTPFLFVFFRFIILFLFNYNIIIFQIYFHYNLFKLSMVRMQFVVYSFYIINITFFTSFHILY